jgi:thiamine kinase-like enzyme
MHTFAGRISLFLSSDQYRGLEAIDFRDEVISLKIARKFAELHHLVVPVSNESLPNDIKLQQGQSDVFRTVLYSSNMTSKNGTPQVPCLHLHLQSWIQLAENTSLVREAQFLSDSNDQTEYVYACDGKRDDNLSAVSGDKTNAVVAKDNDAHSNISNGILFMSRRTQLIMTKQLDFQKMKKEAEFLLSYLSRKHASRIAVFSHNDLNPGNILMKRDVDQVREQAQAQSAQSTQMEAKQEADGYPRTEADDTIMLLDFEYSGYNYRGYDLGNYMCESYLAYGGPYPGYIISPDTLFPSKKFIRRFAEAYTERALQLSQSDLTQQSQLNTTQTIDLNDKSTEESEVKSAMISAVESEAYDFMLASHLLWSFWSIRMADTSNIEFGYLEYALSRMKEYYRLKVTLSHLDSDQ